MPVEQAKEAAKLVVETSGSLSGMWQWIIGSFGGGGILGAIGYMVRFERRMVSKTEFEKHTNAQEATFTTLFEKHDTVLDKVSSIQASVARIEGKLDK